MKRNWNRDNSVCEYSANTLMNMMLRISACSFAVQSMYHRVLRENHIMESLISRSVAQSLVRLVHRGHGQLT